MNVNVQVNTHDCSGADCDNTIKITIRLEDLFPGEDVGDISHDRFKEFLVNKIDSLRTENA